MTISTLDGYTPSKGKNIAAWVLQLILAAAFLAAAGAKLAGVPMMVEVFQKIGLGQGFRYVTACVEILGAVGLLVRGYAPYAGLWLATTMFFATLAHLFVLHTNPAPPIVFLVLTLTVVWLRRYQLSAKKFVII